ncbi:amidohydrolase family protein [Salipiger sp. P9]|uniref:amidohydrolase family protein n=1 Tax=Salipiger pentaromativorans TaxID=2943193 RepID=UPI0021572382|nr:amidohydrolase family protein [Salipiger pentaromativorans]MCR8551201.1 amidohydrolase family protein [Salipiger pentaromativorans]
MQTRFGQIMPPDEEWLSRAGEEPVLDPDLPIVDAHVHLWHPQGQPRYFAEEHAGDALGCGHRVVASVFAECRSMYRRTGPAHLRCVGETEFAAGMAAIGASGRYGELDIAAAIVGHADLTLDEGRLRETLEAHIAAGNGRFRGVRQRAKWDPDPTVRGPESAQAPGVYRSPAFLRGLATLGALDLSLDASVFHPQIPDVTAMARHCPEARIVLIHSGSPVGYGAYAGRDREVHATWLSAMTELARCPNVHVKLGGLLLFLANFDYGRAAAPPSSQQLADLWRPYIEPCLELFGPRRCMVESNYPVDKAGIPYATVWNMFKRLLAGCSRAEKTAVLGGTAARFYRIGGADTDSERNRISAT